MGTNGDNPESSDINAHTVKHHDIIVLGTDGLWDNIHRPKIVDLFRPFTSKSDVIYDHVDTLAEKIAMEAEKHSYLQRYNSPFAENARAHNMQYNGGKPDDITVVVAQV